jgi:hypothetical protein
MVCQLIADHYRQLEGPERQRLDRPFGGGIGRVQKLGLQPVNWNVQFFGNAMHPRGTPSWAMRLTLAFLYPKQSKE